MNLALAVAGSYLLGAIPTSFVVARTVAGVDLRTVGSKNLGATNLHRVLGWRYAVPVALFDMFKGAVPVLFIAPRVDAEGASWLGLLLGVVAVIGHIFSVFVHFRGGKGVATAAGVVMGLAPWGTLTAFAVWGTVVRLTGFVSLGSISAALVLPVAAYLLDPHSRFAIGVVAALSLLVVIMHRQNIKRLLRGTEHRFGAKANR